MFIPPVPSSAGPLGELLNAMRDAIRELDQPTKPHPLFALLNSELPAAADYELCAVWVTDLEVVKVSNGASWVSI